MNVAWLQSIGVGALGGTLDAGAAELIDRRGFNFTKEGLPHLMVMALVGAVIALAAFWKRSPKDKQRGG